MSASQYRRLKYLSIIQLLVAIFAFGGGPVFQVMAKARVMAAGWLTIIKSIGGYVAGWGVSVFIAWHGLSQLWRWYTTGELLASFRGMDNHTKWQLITYESHPLNFTSLLVISVLTAAVGLVLCAGQYWVVRKWWRNKPRSTRE